MHIALIFLHKIKKNPPNEAYTALKLYTIYHVTVLLICDENRYYIAQNKNSDFLDNSAKYEKRDAFASRFHIRLYDFILCLFCLRLRRFH